MQSEPNKSQGENGPGKKAPGFDETVERDSGSDPALDDPDPGRSPGDDDPDTEGNLGKTDDNEDENENGNGNDLGQSNFSIGG